MATARQGRLLALKDKANGDRDTHPLDVLDAESGGQIGCVVELELDKPLTTRTPSR